MPILEPAPAHELLDALCECALRLQSCRHFSGILRARKKLVDGLAAQLIRAFV
jgi:hypothetical protein